MEKVQLVGKGNTAEVFEHENGKVCKLFFEGYPNEYVELEFRNAREMDKCGIRVPKAIQMIMVGNRKGIVYEKVEGKSLLNIMIENTESLDLLLDMFVNVHREIISHHSEYTLSYKKYLSGMLKSKGLDEQSILEQIDLLPDGNCILHGDFHPDNILVTSEGEAVVIDFMNVCHGPALYDVARTYFLIKQFNSDMADKYLGKLGLRRDEITDYLVVIEFCRKYEES